MPLHAIATTYLGSRDLRFTVELAWAAERRTRCLVAACCLWLTRDIAKGPVISASQVGSGDLGFAIELVLPAEHRAWT